MPVSRTSLACATLLGLLALLPFAAGVYYGYSGLRSDARDALAALWPYLAVIIGFIGGAQWGRILAAPQAHAVDMGLAVLPSLIAWAALLLGAPWQGLLLLVALIAGWAIDERGAHQQWQGRGFLQLRRALTAVVLVCMLLLVWQARG